MGVFGRRSDYADIARSMSRDYVSNQFLVDTAQRLQETTVRSPGGGAKYEYVAVGDPIPCRVTVGSTRETTRADRQVTTLEVNILMPPGTYVAQNDRVRVTSSETGEVKVYEVTGVAINTFEVLRKITALQVV
ncbi:MAG: hypothetical protein M3P49_09660 [Actinomycetota bacterium]|nr:hypothetical protein [Actinomycetota bacterium]